MSNCFVLGREYIYNGIIRKGSGATLNTKWLCVAVGERFALVYFDGRKCGTKETTVAVEHGDGYWKET